jgi:hypothetical protein
MVVGVVDGIFRWAAKSSSSAGTGTYASRMFVCAEMLYTNLGELKYLCDSDERAGGRWKKKVGSEGTRRLLRARGSDDGGDGDGRSRADMVQEGMDYVMEEVDDGICQEDGTTSHSARCC